MKIKAAQLALSIMNTTVKSFDLDFSRYEKHLNKSIHGHKSVARSCIHVYVFFFIVHVIWGSNTAVGVEKIVIWFLINLIRIQGVPTTQHDNTGLYRSYLPWKTGKLGCVSEDSSLLEQIESGPNCPIHALNHCTRLCYHCKRFTDLTYVQNG